VASFPADPAPLTSGNTRVKNARKLARRSFRAEERLFLADGPKAVEGALSVPGCVVEVFATPAATQAYAALAAAAPAWTLVDDRALASLSDSVNPAGVVAVARFLDRPLAHVLDRVSDEPALLAICADVRDPGNAGTVVRCADAAGADAVVFAGHSVDAYNPKTVRASVGSLFHLPLAVEPDPAAAVRAAQAAGLVVLAADGAGEIDLEEADDLLAGPTAWLFGNEAWGLPDELAALADHRVRIPIHGRAESLNLSTAAALCLYASARAQRARRPA
jgi:TrmH family RNA methyltransferase